MPIKPSVALLSVNVDEIKRIVLANNGFNPRIFGSVLHGTDTEESDLDLLLDPKPEMTYFNIGAIMDEVQRLLGVPVDVATPDALPKSSRDRILREAKPL